MESSVSHCGKFLAACCGLVNEDPIRATDSLARHPFRAPVATSHSKSWKHDVFLSFRGEDTRKTIISHLFSLLEERGVNVFIDTNGLEKGGDISSQLIDTIRSSRISVVIFSHDYAGSRWCLQELVEIMECKNKSQGQIVLPVFYDVVPSDVRNQRGDFGKAFAKHKHSKNVAQWRAALTEAGSLTGWDMTNFANGSEAEIVRKIARAISNKLNSTYLDVPKYSVGLERRMMRVNEHMSDGSNDVRFVVISGIGGVGKTTLAKAVYNQFANTFEANCFLANIGENSKQPNGLVHLQEQLLKDVLQYEGNLGSVDRGSNIIKERVSSRRVLVILDNLTHRDQRKALAREREWFGPGSRIIITTRNLDMMKEIIKADFVYTLEGLDDDESLQLFSMHAFGSSRPKEGFMELSKRVVCYCEGLPLALEVLGASLLDQSVEEWESEISKLKQIPHDDIQNGIPPRGISRVDTLPVEIFNTDKSESTSVPDKLEKSKTAKQRPHNVLAEEATPFFDNNIPVQQKYIDKSESTSVPDKLEKSKTAKQRPHNVLAEEAGRIFDNNIPVQQKYNDKSESTSVPDKLEKSKTAKQRPHNVLAEEASRILDNNIPFQQKYIDKSESTSVPDKLEKSKTAKQRPHNVLGEEATRIFDNNIPVHQNYNDKSESTSVPDKLEKSKTAKQRPHNVLAEEATRIFDNNIPVQQKYIDMSESTSVPDKLEKSKTAKQRPHNVLAEETTRIFDNNISFQQKYIDKSESTSVPDKLDKSKTAKQRPHNVLAEEAVRIFDNNIPIQQKLQLLNRIATVKDDGTVEFEVPVDAEPHYPGVKPKDMDNEVVDNETLDATDLQYIPPLQIVMLIVGTRGDVQPFVAIGKRLQDYGHRVRLATHSNFKEFVLTAGLEFYPLGGDPKVLAGYMVKNKGFLPSGPSEIPIQRNQIKEIINSLQAACKDPDVDSGIPFKADAIIANPPAYGHTHVAEALKVPLHIFSTMPWTPTSEFPHPLSRVKQQAGYRLSYQIVDSLIWVGIRDMINDVRKKKLKLRPVTYLSGSEGSDSDVPYGYIWSPHLVPKPKDWGPKVDVVGFCFLDLASNYEPPEELVKWLQAGEKPIYIGFGSLPVLEPEKMTQVIVVALETTGQRGIINKGWGGLGNLAEPKESVYLLDNIPHDWLFLQCKAVVHHGGAGTTAAGLRAACPTTIVPFFGDQPFWGERVHARGVGPPPIPVDEFSLPKLVEAINFMLDPQVKERAVELAKAMEYEDGVTGAMKAFFKHLPWRKPDPEPEQAPSSFFSISRSFGCS